MKTRTHTNEAGIVLVITLWVIVVLSTSALALLRQVQLESKMVGFQRDTAIVDQIAKAGVRQALVLLREDLIKDHGEDFQETNLYSFKDNDHYQYDGGNEPWAENPELYFDVPFYENGEKIGSFFVTVRDESAKFPINNGNTNIEQIAHLLELTGVEEDNARQLAGAIIDWRDSDMVVSDVGGSGFGQGDASNENAFYSGERNLREGEIPPVIFKNAPFDSVEELLLIPGFTPEIVYGTVEPEEESRRGGRFRRRRMGRGEFLGLQNYMTVYSSKANLNTIKQEVLEALLYSGMADQAETLAEEWVEYRNGRDGTPYTEDDNVLKTWDNSDLDDMHYTEAKGFTQQVVESLQNFTDIKSNNFVITSLAEYQGIEKGFRVVLNRWYTPWENLPQFGFETNDVKDLQQTHLQIRIFEPLFDANQQIDRKI